MKHFYVQVRYETPRGGSAMRAFVAPEMLAKFVDGLRRPAVICDVNGDPIGKVYDMHAGVEPRVGHPGRRWGWQYDESAAYYENGQRSGLPAIPAPDGFFRRATKGRES